MQRPWPLLLILAAAATASAQTTADIVPNENLVVDGVPRIPASVAEGVGRYTEFRTAGLGAWHPLRREILITTRFADTNQVHRVRRPGGARTQLTFFPDRVAGVSYEPRRGDFFLFSKDKGGDEFGQLFRYDLATGASTLITDGRRSQNGGVRWSSRGDRIAYASTRRNGRDRDIYVMDPRQPQTDRMVLQGEGGGWSARDWSPDDAKLLVAEGLSANESRLWVVDVSERREDAAHAEGGRARQLHGSGVLLGRHGRLRQHGPGRGVPPAGPHRRGDGPADAVDRAPRVGRRRHRPLQGRAHDRVRDQRGRRLRAAPARHGHGQGEAGAEARPGRRGHRRDRVASRRRRARLHLRLRAHSLRRLLPRRGDGEGGRAGRRARRAASTRPASRSRSSCAGRASTAGPSRAGCTSRPRGSRDRGR